jgi:drug/metabolite transporter (DMT)-like permease
MMNPPQASASQALPIAINLVAAVLGALGQYAYKLGSAQLKAVSLFRNLPLLAGIAIFGVVMAMFVVSFRLGGRLSVVYPMYATTFLWGTLLGVVLDREPWSPLQLVGGFVTVAGLSLVAWGAPSAP